MFFVFGVSRFEAVKNANKSTSIYHKGGQYSDEEFRKIIKNKSDIAFDKMKAEKISGSFSTPSLAMDFIKIARESPDDFRDLKIKYRKPTGKINAKTKKNVMEWVIYCGEKTY